MKYPADPATLPVDPPIPVQVNQTTKGISQEEIRAQVDRLASSPIFSTAETQKRLLVYLAEKSLSADSTWLKEYTIGVEALGKPATYDPQRDSIVRIQASRLRQRLATYYREHGPQDSVVVDLPKGQFKLTFTARVAPETASLAVPPRAVPWRWIALSLGVALIIVSGWAAWATRRVLLHAQMSTETQESWSSEMAELWAPFMNGNRRQNRRPLLVSTGASVFFRVQGIGFVRIPGVNAWSEATQSETLGRLTANFTKTFVPWTNFTLLGESAAVFHVARLMGMRQRDVIFTNTTTLSWAEIAQHDMIFIGPPKSIPHVKEMPEHEYILEGNGVRNLRPQPGEPDFFGDRGSASSPSDGESHALLSRISGIGQDAEVLYVGGNWGPDTLAAVQYLTEPRLAAELAGRIRLPNGALPRHYQAVIRVQFKNMTPLRSSIVSHRVRVN